MKEKKNPDISLYLPREIFNSLITVLSYFIATEKGIGGTFFSTHPARLKTKIFRHGRILKNKGGEKVSIHFYEIELAMLMKLLIYYISLGENPTADYFKKLEKIKIKKQKYKNN